MLSMENPEPFKKPHLIWASFRIMEKPSDTRNPGRTFSECRRQCEWLHLYAFRLGNATFGACTSAPQEISCISIYHCCSLISFNRQVEWKPNIILFGHFLCEGGEKKKHPRDFLGSLKSFCKRCFFWKPVVWSEKNLVLASRIVQPNVGL